MSTMRQVRLVRGESGVSELRTALDSLGVGNGQAFVVMAASERDRLGRLAGARMLDHPELASEELEAPRDGAARSTDPDTSKAAAKRNAPTRGSQRWRLLEVIVAAGVHGMTGEEASEATGIPYARSSGPRLAELKGDGLLEVRGSRSGSMGADQEVLVATAQGLAVLASGGAATMPPPAEFGPSVTPPATTSPGS